MTGHGIRFLPRPSALPGAFCRLQDATKRNEIRRFDSRLQVKREKDGGLYESEQDYSYEVQREQTTSGKNGDRAHPEPT